MKEATMTKVPTRGPLEQTRSVTEMADSCACEGDIMSFDLWGYSEGDFHTTVELSASGQIPADDRTVHEAQGN